MPIRRTLVNGAVELARGNFKYLVTRRFVPLPLRYLTLNVTYRCNARCLMCNIWQRKPEKEMSRRHLEAVLEDAAFRQVEDLVINGGEATLRRDVVEIVASCIARMPGLASLAYTTNGLLSGRVVQNVRRIAALCAPRGIRLTVSVSVDGVGEVHDRIRGVDGAFSRTLTTLHMLRDLQKEFDFSVTAACVISGRNVEHLEALERFLELEQVPLSFILVGFHSSYLDNLEAEEQMGFREEEKRRRLEAWLRRLANQRALLNFRAFYWDDMYRMVTEGRPRQTLCPLIMEGAALDMSGNVYYCLSERPLGNIHADGSFSDIYFSKKSQARRSAIMRERCPRCESGCMAEVGVRNQILPYVRFLLSGPTGGPQCRTAVE